MADEAHQEAVALTFTPLSSSLSSQVPSISPSVKDSKDMTGFNTNVDAAQAFRNVVDVLSGPVGTPAERFASALAVAERSETLAKCLPQQLAEAAAQTIEKVPQNAAKAMEVAGALIIGLAAAQRGFRSTTSLTQSQAKAFICLYGGACSWLRGHDTDMALDIAKRTSIEYISRYMSMFAQQREPAHDAVVPTLRFLLGLKDDVRRNVALMKPIWSNGIMGIMSKFYGTLQGKVDVAQIVESIAAQLREFIASARGHLLRCIGRPKEVDKFVMVLRFWHSRLAQILRIAPRETVPCLPQTIKTLMESVVLVHPLYWHLERTRRHESNSAESIFLQRPRDSHQGGHMLPGGAHCLADEGMGDAAPESK